jgi:hypothetical protein
MKRKHSKTYKKGLNLFSLTKSRLINLVKKLTKKMDVKKRYKMRGG